MWLAGYGGLGEVDSYRVKQEVPLFLNCFFFSKDIVVSLGLKSMCKSLSKGIVASATGVQVLFYDRATKDFPHFSQMKLVPRVLLWYLLIIKPQILSAMQVSTTIKSPFDKLSPRYQGFFH